MKRKLLFLGTAMTLALASQAEVSYHLLYIGEAADGTATQMNLTGTAAKKNLSYKGEDMTANGDGSYSCHPKKIVTLTEKADGTLGNTGFKLIAKFNAEGQPTDEATKAKLEELKLSATEAWFYQIGAKSDCHSLLDVREDGPKGNTISFADGVKENGLTPGEFQFAGGVCELTECTVTFWPAENKIKVTGTPTKWRTFGIGHKTDELKNGVNKWEIPDETYHFTHPDNAGVYVLESYDFGQEEGVKEFKIRGRSGRPYYGFTAGQEPISEPAAPAAAEAGNPITVQLAGFHDMRSDHRTIGADGKVTKDANQTEICLPIKANLKGTYTLSLNTHTSVLTLTKTVPSQSKGVEIEAENAPVEYFNLQGVKVANPENGIFIRRCGSKVSKVILK